MENETHEKPKIEFLAETVKLIGDYVSNNQVSSTELPNLIGEVHKALSELATADPKLIAKSQPAVHPKKSVSDDYIICLEDGKKFKSLKRHLRSHFDLSPKEYRDKWGLPADYPMVAPSYAKRRSRLAKNMGLGRKPGTTKQNGAQQVFA
ncbi:MAG: MucR family transcriptional regulator [Pseudomonadota bacterium]